MLKLYLLGYYDEDLAGKPFSIDETLPKNIQFAIDKKLQAKSQAGFLARMARSAYKTILPALGFISEKPITSIFVFTLILVLVVLYIARVLNTQYTAVSSKND